MRRLLTEREDVQAVRSGLERMRVGEREMHDAVVRTHVVADRIPLALPLDGYAGSAEHPEDLLLGSFLVERGRPLPSVDLDSLNADRAVLRSEIAPGADEVSPFRTP